MKFSNSYKPHIDGLRAIAVLSVLLFHLDLPYITGGFVGVDVFFVISGYLITGNILRSLKGDAGFSFLDFYYRRVKRIFPAMFVTLVAALILSIALLVPAKFTLFGGTLAAAAASVANIFLYSQSGYFDIFSQSNPLLHMWSLGVEEQFYIFWPVLLLLMFKVTKNMVGLFGLLLIISLGSLAWSMGSQGSDTTAIYYLTQYRAFELCIGAAICWLPQLDRNGIRLLGGELLCIAGLVMVVYCFFAYDHTTVFPSYNALLPSVGAALVVYAGANTVIGRILSVRPVVFIGLISYSLYLVHWPVIVFTKTLNENFGHGYGLSDLEKLCVGLASVVLAYFLYSFVEVKTRGRVHKSKKSKKAYLIKWTGLYLVLVFVGLFIYNSAGWIWRTHTPNDMIDHEKISDFHARNWGGAGFIGGEIYRGKSGVPSLVMMGDSHNGMLNTGIVNKIARPYELTVFTVSGGGAGKYASSLMLPGTTSIRNPQDVYDMISRDATLEVVEALSGREDSVLLYSASYPSHLMDSTANLDDHKKWKIIAGENDGSYQAYKPFLEALDRLREKIDGRKLIIMGSFPSASKYSLHLCIAKIKWFSDSSCQAEEPRLGNAAALEVNEVLQKYAGERENVYFINPYDVMCNETVCKNLDGNGYPFYSDTSHLSQVGSDYFVELVRDQLLGIMNVKGNSEFPQAE